MFILSTVIAGATLGGTIGGAIGEFYSYIDVAVFDPDAFAIILEDLNTKISFALHYQPFMSE